MPRNEFEDDAKERGRSAVAVETLRSASLATRAEPETRPTQQTEERVSLFWRIFGGTILSVVALGAITLYNNLSSSISELRSDLGREREARAELVKKDEFQSRNQSQYERIRAAEGLKADLEGLKERTNANAAAIDAVKKDTAGVEVLKERVTTLTADLKAAREDVIKLQQELDKNRTADLERKATRDTQAKLLDDTIKELQKDLQSCRLKLAKLEGQLPMVQPASGAKSIPPKDESDED